MSLDLTNCVIVLAIFCLTATEQKSQPADPFYIAGVVEFPNLPSDYHPVDVLQRLTEFRQLIEQASVHPDIIVFPERVLNNVAYPILVPAPQHAVVPCANSSYNSIINRISCYARSLQMYLLINVIEMEHTVLKKHKNVTYYYNTNVVFDRKGVVISRYRKYNMMGSEWQYLNYTKQPELEATFVTDFNVTFGHFTRMDLLYYRPAQALVEQGIMNFLHPSKWQSELPFMTAMQLHQSWAYANNVNLLVAGTNDPNNGRTGTGIYSGKYGALIASMTTVESKKKLHLNVLPKRTFNSKNMAAQQVVEKLRTQTQNAPQQYQQQSDTTTTGHEMLQFTDRITGVKLGRQSDIDLYTTLLLNDFTNDSDELHEQVCHGQLCCNFHLRRKAIERNNATQLPEGARNAVRHYYYRLAVFEGTGTFLNTEPDVVAVCALFACVGDHIYTCGRIFDEATLVENRFAFEHIQISGNFTKPTESLVLPNSVDGMLMPLPVDSFDLDVRVVGNFSFVKYTLLQPKVNLLTFGIYVNYFTDESIYDHHHSSNAINESNNDENEEHKENAANSCCSTALLIFIISLVYLKL